MDLYLSFASLCYHNVTHFKDHSIPLIQCFLAGGQLCPLVGPTGQLAIWDLWRSFLLSFLGKCYWYPVDIQRCCLISYNAKDTTSSTTTTKNYPIQNVNSAKVEKLYPS